MDDAKDTGRSSGGDTGARWGGDTDARWGGDTDARWGSDIDLNEFPRTRSGDDPGPRWEPTPERKWRPRRIVLAVAGGLAAGLIGVGGVLALLSLTGSPGDPNAGPDDVDPGGGAPDVAAVIPASLEWYAVDGTLGFVNQIVVASDGTFYALSTAPGRVDVWPAPRAIYHTVDGENWDFAVLDDEIAGSKMAESSGTLYLIGTAPGFAGFGATPEYVISSTTDAGMTWDQYPLPTEALPPVGIGQEAWTETSLQIASSQGTLVASVMTTYWFDWWSLVPQEVLGNDRDVRPTDDGVEVIDYSIYNQLEMDCEAAGGFRSDVDVEELPEPCRKLATGDVEEAVVATFTFEELGLEGGNPAFSEMFVSTDGVTWERVDSPFVAGRSVAGMFSTGSGFIGAQYTNRGGVDVWMSTDGRTWRPGTGLPAFDWIVAAGRVGGDDVILGSVRGQATAAWSDGAGGWEVIDLIAIADEAPVGHSWINTGAVGPLGVVALIETEGEGGPVQGGPRLIRGTAPDDWSTIPLDTLVGENWGFSDWIAVGHDQVLARFVDAGGPQPINLQLIGLPG